MADGDTATKQPVFSILAAVFVFICALSPLLFITVPVMLTVGMGIVAIVRKERPRWVAPLAVAASLMLLFYASQQLSEIRNSLSTGNSSGDLSGAEISDWSWDADPSFGGKGTIKWRVAIHNKTDKPISSVEVAFTSYDENQHMLTNTMTFVTAIPPGGTRNDESYADYYGTEKTANVAITAVRYSE